MVATLGDGPGLSRLHAGLLLLRLVVAAALAALFAAALLAPPAAPGTAVATVQGGMAAAGAYLADSAAQQAHLSLLAAVVRDVRTGVLLPLLHFMVGCTAFLSAMVASDRLYHYYVAFYWRYVSRISPEAAFPPAALPDPLSEAHLYPLVVVQLPMYNEAAVCRNVIAAACELDWPRGRLRVQVLDDSTDEAAREAAAEAVAAARAAGIDCVLRWRACRDGYKAGAMAEAMPDIAAYEYVAVFDSDFQPTPDFLKRTIPHLMGSPDCGFVQARWVYSNTAESLLTRVQAIGLNYHIKCEQYARAATAAFFNFNGSGGVWRRATIEAAGGWNARTTVEDMDLSLRCYLQGWRFCFLYDVPCVNEIPSSYDAYRRQQHRWSAGPMQLWRKATAAVWASTNISWAQKLYLNMYFFGTRLFATHIVSFVFYCCLVPMAVITPELRIPVWSLVYMPLLVTISTVAFTPGGWRQTLTFVLFENAMSVVKLSAMVSGLLELSDAHEWVVTQKLGTWAAKVGSKAGTTLARVAPAAAVKLQRRKIYKTELGMALLFAVAAVCGVAQGRYQACVFLTLQGLTFAAFGLSCVDGHKRQACCA
jgi:beta-mannan synthase